MAEDVQRQRLHAAVVAEHDESGHNTPPVGRELAGREAKVPEHLAKEVVEREVHPSLQHIRVHADGTVRRRTHGQVARKAPGELLWDVMPHADRVDLLLGA